MAMADSGPDLVFREPDETIFFLAVLPSGINAPGNQNGNLEEFDSIKMLADAVNEVPVGWWMFLLVADMYESNGAVEDYQLASPYNTTVDDFTANLKVLGVYNDPLALLGRAMGHAMVGSK